MASDGLGLDKRINLSMLVNWSAISNISAFHCELPVSWLQLYIFQRFFGFNETLKKSNGDKRNQQHSRPSGLHF